MILRIEESGPGEATKGVGTGRGNKAYCGFG